MLHVDSLLPLMKKDVICLLLLYVCLSFCSCDVALLRKSDDILEGCCPRNSQSHFGGHSYHNSGLAFHLLGKCYAILYLLL